MKRNLFLIVAFAITLTSITLVTARYGPEEELPAFFLEVKEYDNCMEGVYEQLFQGQ